MTVSRSSSVVFVQLPRKPGNFNYEEREWLCPGSRFIDFPFKIPQYSTINISRSVLLYLTEILNVPDDGT
jgi:hypothetical protein